MLPRPVFDDVTVCLASHNCRDTIVRAIESALACAPAAVLVVDDGSTDGTDAVLRGKAREEPRLHVLFNERNAGVAVVRNRLLAACRTRFLMFLDDDDEAPADRIARQRHAFLQVRESLGHDRILCYGARRVEGSGKVLAGLGAGQVVASRPLYLFATVGLRHPGLRPGLFGTGTLFAAAEPLRTLGGFDANLRRNEDTELVIRAAQEGFVCTSVAEVVLHQHPTPGAEKKLAVEFAMRNRILRKHWKTMMKTWPLLPAAYFGQSLALRAQGLSTAAKRGLRALSLLFVNPADLARHLRSDRP